MTEEEFDLERMISNATKGLDNIGGPDIDTPKIKWLYKRFLVAPRRIYETRINELEKLLQVKPENRAAHYLLGKCLEKKKDKKRAKQEHMTAYQTPMDNEYAVLQLSELLRYLNRPFDAYSICMKCSEYMPDSIELDKECDYARKAMKHPKDSKEQYIDQITKDQYTKTGKRKKIISKIRSIFES